MSTFLKVNLNKSDDQTNIDICCKYYRLPYHIKNIPKIMIRQLFHVKNVSKNVKKDAFLKTINYRLLNFMFIIPFHF